MVDSTRVSIDLDKEARYQKTRLAHPDRIYLDIHPSKLASDLEPGRELVEGLSEMGDRAEEMVRVALDSFACRDVERAHSLSELDELIDRTNRRVAEKVLAMAATPGTQEWGLRMIVVSRCIERIGDNAVDIGEQTAFVVTGLFREFTDASHPEPVSPSS